MTDEQLIDRIRSSLSAYVADLEPPPDLIQRLHDELAQSNRRSIRSPRLRLPSLGGVFAALATCAALALAALILVSLGHRHPRSRGTVGSGPSQLIAKLAVLRRPQTAADRSFPSSALRGLRENEGPFIPRLTRLVATIHGTRLFLFVVRPSDAYVPAQGPLWSPSLGDRVVVTDAIAQVTLPVPAAELRDPYLASFWEPEPSQKKDYFVELVPDGVKRVRIVFKGGTTVYAKPANNTVVALAPAGANETVRSVTWYGASGHVIPTLTQASDKLRLRAQAARAAADRAGILKAAERVPDRTPPALLRHFPVFSPDTERPVSAHGITIWHPALTSVPWVQVLQFTNNPHALREVMTTLGLRFWVDPGPLGAAGSSKQIHDLTYVCLREIHFVRYCKSSLASVLATGVWGVAKLPDGTPVIYGIVPDTNQTITVRLAGGRTRTVPVVHGVVVTPAAAVSQILVKGINGKTSVVPPPRAGP